MSKSEYESVLESLEWTNKGLRELRAKGVIGVFVDEQTEPLKISNSKSDTY